MNDEAPNRTKPITRQDRLQLGIIGFGRVVQQYYLPALQKRSRELQVSIADPLQVSQSAARKAFHDAPVYSDYRELLDREALHAVLVATPPSSHLEIWQETNQYGLPVFMEKPLLLPGQLDRIDQADPAWQNLMINFNRRFWPTYQRIGAQVSDGSLERLSHARFVLKINAAKWSTVTDHRAKEHEGGVLYDLGSQALDLLSVTFQLKPTEILARRSGMGGFDDRVQLTLGFSDGFTADCDLAYGTYNQESITIWANNTVLNLYDPNCVAWVGHDPWGVLRYLRTLVDWPLLAYRGIFRDTSMLRYSVRASLEAFLAALKSTAPFNPGFNDALQVARYTEAARRSIETGRSISFD